MGTENEVATARPHVSLSLMASGKSTTTLKPKAFVLGRSRFEKISAVEGIKKTAASRLMFEEFDRKGLTPDQRRKVLLKKYAKGS